MDADYSLSLVLELLKPKIPQSQLLLCSGDLSNESGTKSLERLQQMLPQDINTAWLPGNHDENDCMQEVAAAHDIECLSTIALGKWQVTLLDSSAAGEVGGFLSDAEIMRAISVLEAHPDKYHVFFMHHHLLPMGCKWLDWQAVTNSEQVLERLAQYPQLRAIVHGHVHQECQQKYKHIDIFATPSTCIQFKPMCDEFTLDSLMPGFRQLELADDGSITTQVHRIATTDFGVDYQADGY